MDALTRRFTRVSGRVEAVFGYPSDSWRTLPGFWIGILHPEDRRRIAQAVHRVLRDRQPCEIEYRAVASDGAEVRVRDQVRVVSDSAGNARLLQGRMVVHDRPRAEPPEPVPHVRRARYGRGRLDSAWPAQVWARREAAPPRPPEPIAPQPVEEPEPPPEPAAPPPERVLASLAQAVVVSDAEHRVTFWNRAAEVLFGWSAAEAIGRLDAELVPARAGTSQNAEILAALIHGRPWSAEVEARTRDDLTVPVMVSASAVSRPDGTAGGFVAVITDLREVRRDAAVRLREATMEAVASLARAAGRELGALADRMDSLVGHALSRLAPHDAALADDLAAIRRAADEAGSLALELRDAGRDRAAVIRPVDLGELVLQNRPALELLATASVRISTRIEPAPRAWLDPVAISQALFHFAADACHAMADDGRLEIRVAPLEVSPRRAAEAGIPAGQFVTLEIRDTRATFAPADPDRWFDPAAGPDSHALRRSAAHGLVRQCGAWVTADPAIDGNGIIIRVYFRVVRTEGVAES